MLFLVFSPRLLTADRICKPLRTCGVLEYELTPPTLTSNRVCAPLSRCATVCRNGQHDVTGAPCSCGLANCSACRVDGSVPACIECNVGQRLYADACVGTCPEGTTPGTRTSSVGKAVPTCLAADQSALPPLSLRTEFENTVATITSDRGMHMLILRHRHTHSHAPLCHQHARPSPSAAWRSLSPPLPRPPRMSAVCL